MSRITSDRNLLFGILALQMDFVSRDALVAAMNAWVLDKSRSLGHVLQEQGVLRADEVAVLDSLVDKHLSRHGQDVQQSLAALPVASAVAPDLAGVADADVQASLVGLTTAEADPQRTSPFRPPPPDGARYHILRPHARGGLGEVFVALDRELHREVALKEILANHADNPLSRGRFLLEAEVNARLEHPGIVPVYGLGQYADGRPYYAMRFIEGDTLQEAIRRFHALRDPVERRLTLRQLLTRFVAVCNTVAYTHSRGVIHRDLKPANILLGQYGETLVLDWGLAKIVGQAEPSTEHTEPALQPESVTVLETTAGTVLGTPAFMSPEQAAGRLDQLGPASDIWSLGATLYAVLTGRAPVEGTDHGEVLRRVRQGDWLPPGQRGKDVPGALDAVCRKAMAADPRDRYATALELAADVEHWLADEPVSAWREPWRVRAGRWMRRHRVLVAGATAALLALVLLGGGGWLWLEKDRVDREEQVTVELAEVTRLREEARTATPERQRVLLAQAQAAAQRAEGLLGGSGARWNADEALRRRVETVVQELEDEERDWSMLARLQEVRLNRTALDDAEGRAAAAAGYVLAFRKYGVDVQALPPSEAADLLRARKIRVELAAALFNWADLMPKPEDRISMRELCAAVDDDADRDQLRTAILRGDLAALKRYAVPVRLASLPAPTLAVLGGALRGLNAPAEAVTVLRHAQQRYPDDFWGNHELAITFHTMEPPRLDEAIRFSTVTVALSKQSPGAHFFLGICLSDAGRQDEAVAAYRKAIELKEDHVMAWSLLGVALAEKGQADEALSAHRTAVGLQGDSWSVQNNLAVSLVQLGRVADAVPVLEKAIALNGNNHELHANLASALTKLRRLDDAIAACNRAIALQPSYHRAHYLLGHALAQKGRLDDTIAAFREALDLRPNDPETLANLGMALTQKGRPDEAIVHLRRALDLRPDYAFAHLHLGRALAQKGRVDEGVASIHRAVTIKKDYALAYFHLGEVLAAHGRVEEAIAAYRQATVLNANFFEAHFNLANLLKRFGWYDEAIASYQKVVALNKNEIDAHFRLGLVLGAKGRLDEAIAAFNRVIALDRDHAEAHCHLGLAHRDKGEFTAALTALRRGDALGKQRPGWRTPSGEWVVRTKFLAALDSQLPQVLRGEVRIDDEYRRDIAWLCQRPSHRLYGAAARYWEESFRADPTLVEDLEIGNRYEAACAAALAGTGQGDGSGLDDKERARWRRQALTWLQADLALWKKSADGDAKAREKTQLHVRLWTQETALTALKGDAALAKLPEPEREPWRTFWAEVDSVLTRAASKKSAP